MRDRRGRFPRARAPRQGRRSRHEMSAGSIGNSPWKPRRATPTIVACCPLIQSAPPIALGSRSGASARNARSPPPSVRAPRRSRSGGRSVRGRAGHRASRIISRETRWPEVRSARRVSIVQCQVERNRTAVRSDGRGHTAEVAIILKYRRRPDLASRPIAPVPARQEAAADKAFSVLNTKLQRPSRPRGSMPKISRSQGSSEPFGPRNEDPAPRRSGAAHPHDSLISSLMRVMFPKRRRAEALASFHSPRSISSRLSSARSKRISSSRSCSARRRLVNRQRPRLCYV